MRQLAWMALTIVSLGCGGSSSETPWPVEPLDTEPGPAGEKRATGNSIDVKTLPDNYNKQEEDGAGGAGVD